MPSEQRKKLHDWVSQMSRTDLNQLELVYERGLNSDCGVDQVDGVVERAYRRGCDQSFAMLKQWLDDHKDANARDAVIEISHIAHRFRMDRKARSFYLHAMIAEMAEKLKK